MSGIVGIINLDGEPVDRELLGRMTDYMTFRGPDAQQIWVERNVGFGYTQLKTTWEMELEHQPFTLDGQVWIVADARIDDRETLAKKLDLPFQPLADTPTLRKQEQENVVTDVELILRSYLKWGENCFQHLIGDFSFALWDSRKQQLYGFRDQLGVKPFYYSRIKNCFIFCNTLNPIRCHPAVTSSLNDAAIADFLLFEYNLNHHTTTFTDIQRLPPAHTLRVSIEQFTVQRYWQLPTNDSIRYKHHRDYLAHFKSLLQAAVKDRLRANQISLYMSGGLDSTTLAACIKTFLSNIPVNLRAYTSVYKHLIPDQEGYFAGLVAAALDLPIEYLPSDHYQPYDRWAELIHYFPEPLHEPMAAAGLDIFSCSAVRARVLLDGEGGDELLKPDTRPYLRYLWQQGKQLDWIAASWEYGFTYRERGWDKIKQKWYATFASDDSAPSSLPGWLNPEFVREWQLEVRWQEAQAGEWQFPGTHPVRPAAYRAFNYSGWVYNLEVIDPGVSGVNIELRHPLLDLRLLEFCLAAPPIPWAVDKYLIRSLMKNILPEPVRLRPKTTVAADPWAALIKQRNWRVPLDLIKLDLIDQYVDIAEFESHLRQLRPETLYQDTRPLSLYYWLHYISGSHFL